MSIHANSKVITLTHILLLTDGTKNINKPIRVATSTFIITYRGLIIGRTGDVVTAN